MAAARPPPLSAALALLLGAQDEAILISEWKKYVSFAPPQA
jgi:hypothetical protein